LLSEIVPHEAAKSNSAMPDVIAHRQRLIERLAREATAKQEIRASAWICVSAINEVGATSALVEPHFHAVPTSDAVYRSRSFWTPRPQTRKSRRQSYQRGAGRESERTTEPVSDTRTPQSRTNSAPAAVSQLLIDKNIQVLLVWRRGRNS